MIKPYEDYITTSEDEEEEEEGGRSRRKDDEHQQRWDFPKSQSSSWYNNDRTPPSPTVEEEKEGSDDSDQEFLVHPCLRSLIKSKSAYAFTEEAPKMKTSKTTFEMSLSKMYVSTTQSLMADAEPPVALFGLNFDTKWPEPESPKKARKDRKSPSLSKVSGCWSSPPNVYLDDSVMPSSPDSAHGECWSAPECLNDDDRSSVSSEEEGKPLGQGPYSDSYPVIDTPENDPSICSIPLPSSSSTSASSPSPPRPLSPVLGRPAPKQERMSGSRSMQLRPRPSPNAFCSSDAPPGSSDDEWPQKEPWPQQEVWPEPEVLQRRQLSGWDEATPLPRSVSVQFNNSHRVQVPASRSAHSNLNGFVDHIDQSSLQGSAHSQLDEGERTEVSSRQAWMERGSMAQLRIQAAHTIHEDLVYYGHGRNGMVESRNSMGGSAHYLHYDDEGTSEGMRRSYTTQEFRKGRRRLPRRPDAPPFRGELPSSISLYDRSLRDYYGRTYEFSTEERLDIQSMHQSTEIQSVPRQTTQPPTPHERRPPSLHLDAHMDSSKSTRHSMSRADGPYAELETPMSPPFNVLPSPLSTGRRLPALPLHSSILSRLPPMSVPPPPPQKNQDHTLCFMDGMSDSVMGRSTFEDSYYEDDTINGNRYRRQRKSFFSPDDSSGVSSCTTSDSLNPTHRVQSAFHPRHSDEVLLEIGDAVHVERASDDHWSYGTNLRTGLAGIFPSAVVCEIDLVEEICLGALPTATKGLSDERDTFYLTMLASIEVAHHKGNDILIQAMNKVLAMYKNHEEVIVPQTVLMEISFRGIHVIDKRKKNFFQCPTFDFFYSLQNISFCGAHPKQLKYFGYITKHPLLPKFACHVFMSNQSTQPIVESIGRAFKRSYDEYMAFAHPTEDIYLE